MSDKNDSKVVNVKVEKTGDWLFSHKATVTSDRGKVGVSRGTSEKQAIESASTKATKSGGGGCFITTACVETLGLPDDCHEMTVLRQFRDNYLLGSEEGYQAVEEYYRIAPRIVSAVKSSGQPEAEFKEIFNAWLRPSVELIEAGKFQDAFAIYKDCVMQLSRKYKAS